MPLVSYRGSAEGVLRREHSDRVVSRLREFHEVEGLRQSAKQILKVATTMRPLLPVCVST